MGGRDSGGVKTASNSIVDSGVPPFTPQLQHFVRVCRGGGGAELQPAVRAPGMFDEARGGARVDGGAEGG